MSTVPVYSVQQAANILCISESSVHRLALCGELEYVEFNARSKAITATSVDTYNTRRKAFFAEHWTPDEVALKLGVRRVVVDQWVYRGSLVPDRLGGRIGFVPAEVLRYGRARGLIPPGELAESDAQQVA